MCLKIYEKLTFSNREAFERAYLRVDSFEGTKKIQGKIYVIHPLSSTIKNRDNLSYKELQNKKLLHTLEYNSFSIGFLSTLIVFKEGLKEETDLFGEITIELR